MSFLKTGVVTVGALLVAAQVRANPQPLPDIESSNLTINYASNSLNVYDTDSNVFDNMDNIALAGLTSDMSVTAYDTSYNLQANINSSGAFSGGTIEIDSDQITQTTFDPSTLTYSYVDFLPFSPPPIGILTGTLTGFQYSGGIMHFDFTVTGGLASTGAGDLNWFGSKGGININAIGPTLDFSHPITDSTGISTSDVYAVPSPQAGVAGLGLLSGLAILRRRRIASV